MLKKKKEEKEKKKYFILTIWMQIKWQIQAQLEMGNKSSNLFFLKGFFYQVN